MAILENFNMKPQNFAPRNFPIYSNRATLHLNKCITALSIGIKIHRTLIRTLENRS